MRELGRWEREWSQRWAASIKPDPQYSRRERSQYPETAQHLSAPPKAEAEYWAGVDRILAKYKGVS